MSIEETLDRLTKAIEQLSEAIAKRDVPVVNKVEPPKKGKATKAVVEEKIPESETEQETTETVESEELSEDVATAPTLAEFNLILQAALNAAMIKHGGDPDKAKADVVKFLDGRKKADIPESEYAEIMAQLKGYTVANRG